jgi:hypothetical protein
MYHVYPINDEQEHILWGASCPCKPSITWVDGVTAVIVHNAFDCREVVEEAERLAATP